jgi:hypothetical protein
MLSFGSANSIVMLRYAHGPLQNSDRVGRGRITEIGECGELSHRLEVVIRTADHVLERRSTREVAGPEGVWPVSIREEVVCFHGPRLVRFVQRVQVASGRGVENVYVASLLLLFVDPVNCLVQVLEPHVSVGVLKVRAHGHDQVGCFVSVRLILGLLDETSDFLSYIVLVKSRVIHDRLVSASRVKTEAIRRVVAVVQNASEKLSRIAVQISACLPQHLAGVVRCTVVLVLVVHAAQEQAIEAELSEQRCLLTRMSKRIDLPNRKRIFTLDSKLSITKYLD